MTIKIFITTLVVACVAVCGAADSGKASNPAAAAVPPAPQAGYSAPSLVLSPAVLRLNGKFGQSTTQSLQLTNKTRSSITFELVADDIVVRNGERTFIAAGELRGSIAATARFSPSQITVRPGETKSVQISVTVPSDTDIRAVGAFFRSVDKLDLPGRAGMKVSIGSLLTFTLTDQAKVSGSGVEVVPQSDTANLSMSKMLENTGREPVIPSGFLALVDQNGRLIGKTAIEPQRLLPGEKLAFVAEYGGRLRKGSYRGVLTVDYDGKALVDEVQVEIP